MTRTESRRRESRRREQHRPDMRYRAIRPVTVRPGWPMAALAVVLAGLVTAAIALTASVSTWLAGGAITGLVLFVCGVAVGSERLAGLASVPMMASALLTVDAAQGPAWGRSLVIGCLWYAALEAAWGSIEWRDQAVRPKAIATQRSREVAQVVLVSIAVGGGGAVLATVAPTRTLLVRALVTGSVLVALAAAARQLTATTPQPGVPDVEMPKARAPGRGTAPEPPE